MRLEWAPAEAQVDFGVCDFRVLGVVREAHYLVVTFPFSNVSLAVNKKIKVAIRQGYGFRNVDNLIALVILRYSDLRPALPGRSPA